MGKNKKNRRLPYSHLLAKKASERAREREGNPRIIPLLILLLSSAGIISRSDVGSERSKGGALRPLVSGFALKTREEEFRKVETVQVKAAVKH
ncbi:hypothetical protein C4D60_Mb10t02250 [Musa balbisiana]|uniref:Uncharacterized protein n=1 Tax=Musa balbisiana TaxID=52838 RepID=A0A4S8IVF2_MUSBA|nr:hypothetical protein C4D60_Mb10t02250 [Musa balbisiana]